MLYLMWVMMGLIILLGWLAHDFRLCILSVAALAVFQISLAKQDKHNALPKNRRQWLMSEGGLIRVYGDSGTQELISWQSIARMRWLRTRSLLVFWNEAGERGAQFRKEFREGDLAGLYRGVLRVEEAEADAIASHWTQRRGLQPSPGHSPAAAGLSKRPLGRQATKAVWMGVGLGLLSGAWGLINICRELPTAQWPTVQGSILSQHYTDPSETQDSHKHAKLRLTYRYQVNGKQFQSDQYRLGEDQYVGRAEVAHELAGRFPTGAQAEIHYNPNNPEQAVLLAGPDWEEDIASIFIGILFIVLMLVLRRIVLRAGGSSPVPEKNWLFKEYG